MATMDPLYFRKVLSSYPTGVSVIAACGEDGSQHAMVVGSFTSISLDPPLIGFFPTTTSSTWAKIAEVRRFAVSVLGADQLSICMQLASRSDNKFAGIAHDASPAGQPIIDGAIAWLECVMDQVHQIGDHYLVVGLVEALGSVHEGSPLLFFGGNYHGIGSPAGTSASHGDNR